MCTNRCLLYCGEGPVPGQGSTQVCRPRGAAQGQNFPMASKSHDLELWPWTTMPESPHDHTQTHYRVRVSLHLHEGGILKEPQPGGGDGAVLPHRHRGSSWGERGQGLVTWRTRRTLICMWPHACTEPLCRLENDVPFESEHRLDFDSPARCPCTVCGGPSSIHW